jgi:lysyl-tRNA synthetase class 1
MSLLVQFGSIVNWNTEMLEIVFKKIGQPYTREQFKDRVGLARYWLERCAPENVVKLKEAADAELYATLSNDHKSMIRLLHDELKARELALDEVNTFLYSVPQAVLGTLSDKERKAAQAQFFEVVYRLLIGKPQGPRLYLFLKAIEKEKYLTLLNF